MPNISPKHISEQAIAFISACTCLKGQSVVCCLLVSRPTLVSDKTPWGPLKRKNGFGICKAPQQQVKVNVKQFPLCLNFKYSYDLFHMSKLWYYVYWYKLWGLSCETNHWSTSRDGAKCLEKKQSFPLSVSVSDKNIGSSDAMFNKTVHKETVIFDEVTLGSCLGAIKWNRNINQM